jgi:hypothetical protein
VIFLFAYQQVFAMRCEDLFKKNFFQGARQTVAQVVSSLTGRQGSAAAANKTSPRPKPEQLPKFSFELDPVSKEPNRETLDVLTKALESVLPFRRPVDTHSLTHIWLKVNDLIDGHQAFVGSKDQSDVRSEQQRRWVMVEEIALATIAQKMQKPNSSSIEFMEVMRPLIAEKIDEFIQRGDLKEANREQVERIIVNFFRPMQDIVRDGAFFGGLSFSRSDQSLNTLFGMLPPGLKYLAPIDVVNLYILQQGSRNPLVSGTVPENHPFRSLLNQRHYTKNNELFPPGLTIYNWSTEVRGLQEGSAFVGHIFTLPKDPSQIHANVAFGLISQQGTHGFLKRKLNESDDAYLNRVAQGIHKLTVGVLTSIAWRVAGGGGHHLGTLFKGREHDKLRNLDESKDTDYILFTDPYDLNYGINASRRDTSAQNQMENYGIETRYMARWENLSPAEQAAFSAAARNAIATFEARGGN